MKHKITKHFTGDEFCDYCDNLFPKEGEECSGNRIKTQTKRLSGQTPDSDSFRVAISKNGYDHFDGTYDMVPYEDSCQIELQRNEAMADAQKWKDQLAGVRSRLFEILSYCKGQRRGEDKLIENVSGVVHSLLSYPVIQSTAAEEVKPFDREKVFAEVDKSNERFESYTKEQRKAFITPTEGMKQ